MDLEAASSAINSHTAAIMPVHLYGHPVDTSGFAKLAARYGIPMIEDAAQAHGAKVGRQRVGSFGAAAGFSFYPSKNLGALGDAGAVVTNDVEIDRKVRMLRNYGSSSKYVHDILGTNSRLDEIQAAVLRVKLRHLDEWNADRIRAVNSYLDGLASTEVQVITPIPGSTSSWHLLVVRSNQRDALSTHLDHEGVGNLIHYPTPPHLTRAYIDSGRLSALPITERTASEVLSLPLFPGLTSQEIDDVVEAVATFERKSNG
jgi:dTDP-4-amino-4,6-dideoxygalactose transaminase